MPSASHPLRLVVPVSAAAAASPRRPDGPYWDAAWRTMAAPGVAACSFDVFDTILLRRTTEPGGVFDLTWRLLRPLVRGRGGALAAGGVDPASLPVESFIRLRNSAHTLAVLRAGGREVDIDAIYAEFPIDLMGLAEEERPLLAAAEFQAEQRLCYGDPAVRAFYEALRRDGRRVGFISDTYWRHDRLLTLLEGALPGIAPDFLYPSCDWGVNKDGGLFTHYLEQQGLAPETAAHIGDNRHADITPALALGMRPHHHPQAPDLLLGLFQREEILVRLLRGATAGTEAIAALAPRLDEGLRSRRRQAVRDLAVHLPSRPVTMSPFAGDGHPDIADLLGAGVVAPLMAGLHRLARQRVDDLRGRGRRVGVLFLARDGFLPWRVWRRADSGPAAYVGINRRTCLVGVADEVRSLQTFFAVTPRLNADSVADFLKVRLPRVEEYFAGRQDQTATGLEFAAALPDLVTPADLAETAAGLRRSIVDHLRGALADFDACTDLVLVDIGYNGTIHRALQAVLRREGIGKRLHGVYLLAGPNAFRDLPAGDSACGYVDERTLPAQTLDYVIRNVLVMEHFCAAPTGSVRDYADDGSPTFEEDLRPAPQRDVCAAVQSACLGAVDFFPATDDPDGEAAERAWAAVMLARLALMPTPQERALLGPFIHDINLGSKAHGRLEDGESARLLRTVMDLPTACTAPPPPFWMAASLGALSPDQGHAYLLNAFGLLPGDVYADQPDGTVRVSLIHAHGQQDLTARRLRTASGEIRVHIPVARVHMGGVVAVSMADIVPGGGPASGFLGPVCLRTGDSPHQALRNTRIHELPPVRIGGMEMVLGENGMFRVDGPDARLMIVTPDVPAAMPPLYLLTLLFRTGL